MFRRRGNDLANQFRLFLPTAKLYYNIQDLSTLYQDAARTTPADTATDPVGLVEDLSGNGADASQATAAARPLLTFVGNVWGLGFDQSDDVLSATVPEITSGTLILAGRDGIWIDDDYSVSAGTFSIGPTTYTNGPAGILDVVGDVIGAVLVGTALSSAQKTTVIRFFKRLGAPGYFELGAELVTNGTFDADTDWALDAASAISGGELSTTKSNAGTIASQSGRGIEDGALYLTDYELIATNGQVLIIRLNNSSNDSGVARTTTGRWRDVIEASSSQGTLQWNVASNGVNATLDNVSLKKLTLNTGA